MTMPQSSLDAAARQFVRQRGAEFAQLLTGRESVFSRADALFLLTRPGVSPEAAADPALADAILDEFLDRNPAVRRYEAKKTGAVLYTTEEMARIESRLLAQAKRWRNTTGDAMDPADAEAGVDGFMNTPKIRSKTDGDGLAPDIVPALRGVLGEGRLHLVAGPPGVGKSLLALGLAVAYGRIGTKVMVTGPSDVITAGIMGDSKADGMTLGDILSQVAAGRSPIQQDSVVILDEAGMVGSRQMAALFDAVKAKNAKLFLLGDPRQIGPIEAGHPFRAMAETLPYTPLSELYRQSYADDKICTSAIWQGNSRTAIESYDARGLLRFADDAAGAVRAAAEDFVRWRTDPSHDARQGVILCLDEATAAKANRAVRRALKAAGRLQGGVEIDGFDGPIELAPGERIQFFENAIGHLPADGGESNRKIHKGNAGHVEKIDAGSIWVRLDGDKDGQAVRVPRRAGMRLGHAYAMELRRVQGITVHRAFNIFTRHLEAGEGLVALSRHKHKVTTYCDRGIFPDAEAVIRDFDRNPLKMMSSDLKSGYRRTR